MAVAYNNQKVATDGLVLYYDMFNTQKSWKGEPTVNTANVDLINWYKLRVTVDQASPYYKVSNTVDNDSHMLYWPFTATDGVTYTFSVDVKYQNIRYIGMSFTSYGGWTGGSGGHTNFDLYQNVINNYVGGEPLLSSITPNNDGSYRISITATRTGTTGTQANLFFYRGDPITESATYAGLTSENMLMKNPQLEIKSYQTPFVNGERTTTQAILDLTKNETITAADLTYSSENTFSFTKNADHISFPNPINSVFPYTIIQWVRADPALPDTTASGSRKTPMVGPSPTWNPGYWLTARVFRVHAATEYRDYTINWVNDTSWHMIGQTFDGTTVKHIIDGDVFLGTRTAYAPPAQTTIYVGSETVAGSTPSWKGDLPTIMFYDRKLSDAEVRNIFDATKHRYGI